MNTRINQLIEYGLKNKMINRYDVYYSINLLLDLFKLDDFKKEECEECSLYEM